MTLPKLLLVSDVVPGRGNVGREYLRAACRLLPADHIFVYDFDPGGREALAPELEGIDLRHESSPDLTARQETSGWAWARHFDERRREQAMIPQLVERIAAYGREKGIDRVWVPLHSPTSIRIAQPVAEALAKPLITTTWDPPNYKLAAFGVGRRMRRQLLKKFDATNRFASACSAASEPMRDLYERLYGTPTVTMILGAPRPETLNRPDPDAPLRIGFAGSLYARQEFNALRQALDRMNWMLDGRLIELHLYGDHEALADQGRICVHGWADPDSTVSAISACDIAYLPYWFAKNRREVVEVSFPGKLALYAAARTPVFYHGPSYGSPVRFLERFPMGKVCATLDASTVAERLASLLGDRAWLSSARDGCDRAYDEELSADVFADRFAQLLGLPDGTLRPQQREKAGTV